MAATLDQVIALLQLLLPEVAGHHRSAVAIHAIGEVLTGEADARTLPVLQLSLVNEIPFLHARTTQRPSNSTSVLLPRRVWMQHVQRSLRDLFKGDGNAPKESSKTQACDCSAAKQVAAKSQVIVVETMEKPL